MNTTSQIAVLDEIFEEISEEYKHMRQYVNKAMALAEEEINIILSNSKNIDNDKNTIKNLIMIYCYKVKNENQNNK